MFDGRTLHGREVMERLVQAWGDKVFHTVIRRTVKFSDSTVAGEPITSYASTSTGADAYRQLAKEVALPVPRRVSLPAADDLFRRPHRRGRRPRRSARSRCARPGRRRGGARTAEQREPSGRVRHDEKMTVYVTSDELLDLEHARLALRGEHGPGRRPRPAGARGGRAWCWPTSRQNGEDERAGPPTDRGMTDASPSRRRRPPTEAAGFEVRLDNFEGPFDLLLSLISKHKLDITEVALSQVTDEFIAHVKAGGAATWDLEQTTSFLLVAATLLDLKAARLLPQGDVEDEEDLALLEARDLLFARLLQYRAFKQVAGVLERRGWRGSRERHPRAVGLEERFAGLLPEVLIGIGLEQFAALAAKALEPKPVLEVSLQHIHAPAVSVREQAALVVERLRRSGTMTFRALCGDSPDTLTTVARFLSLLELFREGAVAFDQVDPARRADRPLDRRRRRRRRGAGDRRVRRARRPRPARR